jgi:hypothetical protein
MNSHYTNLFFSIILHVFLLFSFLSLFFWIVISKTESKSLYSELNSNIDKSLKNINIDKFTEGTSIHNFINDNKGSIKDYFDGYFSKENMTYERNNNQLLITNIIIVSLIFITLVATIWVRYLICGKTINFLEIIGENILILVFVGAIEYYFFKQVASKFVPVEPSYLTEVVKNKIDKL